MWFESLFEMQARQQYRLERALKAAAMDHARPAKSGAGIGRTLAAFWQWLIGYEAPTSVAARKG